MLMQGRYWRLRLLVASFITGLLGLIVLGKFDTPWTSSKLVTVPARFGEVDTRLEGTAYFLRQEHVEKAPVAGRVTFLVSDGRYVRAGDLVGEIDTGTRGPAVVSIEPSVSSRLSTAAYEAERERLEKRRDDLRARIADGERVLREALSIADAGIVEEAENRLSRLTRDLQAVVDAMESLEQRYRQAEKERREDDDLPDRMVRPEDGRVLLQAPAAGVLSTTWDGLEEEFVPGLPLDHIPDTLRPHSSQIEDGASVSAGEAVFRLVQPNPVEIAVRLSSGFVDAGMKVQVAFRFAPERSFAAQVTEVFSARGRTMARLRLDSFDELLVLHRQSPVVISAKKAEGIVVPASAVVDVRGRPGVYVLLGDRPVFREVMILGGNDKEAVVHGVVGVPIGAPVVANPQAIK